jgi:hypothetical protein
MGKQANRLIYLHLHAVPLKGDAHFEHGLRDLSMKRHSNAKY